MIVSSTFDFLKSVAENNNREWFQSHKAEFEYAKENVFSFTRDVIRGISAFDSSIPPELDPKDCVMRIYRDIRFSKDKTPYKTNFGVGISSNGKNFKGPGYYVHIQPGNSFVGGGSWFPAPDELKAIRQEIDYNQDEWSSIVESAGFKMIFGRLDPEGKLKSTPKGYAPDHPLNEYLKLKSFTAGVKLSDRDLQKKGSAAIVTEMFEKLSPFIVFLRNAIS